MGKQAPVWMLLVLFLGVGIAQTLPDTPYFQRIQALTRQINNYRCNVDSLTSFTQEERALRGREPAPGRNLEGVASANGLPLNSEEYVCLADKSWLEDNPSWTWKDCPKRGVLERGGFSEVFDNFMKDINDQ